MPRTSLQPVVLLSLIALAAGCGSDPVAPAASDRAVAEIAWLDAPYRAGDLARVRVRDVSDRAIEFSLCIAARLERRAGDAWEDVLFEPSAPCALDIHRLEAGEAGSYDVAIPLGLEAGVYRFFFVDMFFTREERIPDAERRSEPFAVLGP